MHVLFGIDHMSVESSSSFNGGSASASASDNGFATALGGGLKFPVSKNFAIGTGFDYLMNRHSGTTLNDIRLQFGVIYQFGLGSGSRN
jgi:opacity protein-like surface antigen